MNVCVRIIRVLPVAETVGMERSGKNKEHCRRLNLIPIRDEEEK